MIPTEKLCSNCKYDLRKTRKKILTCTNEESEWYGRPTFDDDCCSHWEWNGEEA